jgi:hypothetical protein
MRKNFSFDSIHNALVADRFKVNFEESASRRIFRKENNLSMEIENNHDESILLNNKNILPNFENEITMEYIGNQYGNERKENATRGIPVTNISIPKLNSEPQSNSKIFNFKKLNQNDQLTTEQKQIEMLKRHLKTQYRQFNIHNKVSAQQRASNQPEIYQRNRFAYYNSKPNYSKESRFSPRANISNSFAQRPRSMTRGNQMRQFSTTDQLHLNQRRNSRTDFMDSPMMKSNLSSGFSLTKLQNSGSTVKNKNHVNSRGYHNYINVSVPSQYIILQNSHQPSDMAFMKRAASVKQSRFMNNLTPNHYINLTKIRQSNLRGNSYHNSDRGSRSPHRSFQNRLSPLTNKHINESFASQQTGNVIKNSFTPMYSNYIESSLPQVNEYGGQEIKFSQLQSTVSWIPTNVNDLLLLLFKKILVYSSKIDSLQRKIYENNPSFSVKVIFKEMDKERKAYLSLHDMGYFLNYFGFKVSDWEAFKIMGYLSSYRLATLQELIAHEVKTSSNITNIQKKYFGDNKNPSLQRKATDNSKNFFINYDSFSRIFKPADKNFRPKPKQMKQLNYNMNKGIRESEFYIIRQIILLTFRKLDEIGMIVQYMKEYSHTEIFELICRHNEGIFTDSEKSNRFESEQDPEKCKNMYSNH